MKLAVMNASNPTERTLKFEYDFHVDYRDGKQSCFEGDKLVKRASSWHSWAYAEDTEFLVYLKPNWQNVFKYDGVILLVNRDMLSLVPLIKKLKLAQKKVAISFHEGVQDLLAQPSDMGEQVFNRLADLISLMKEADCYINLFPEYNEFFYGMFGKNKVKNVLHAGFYEWRPSFIKPVRERTKDILVGTRTFSQRLLRNTMVSIFALNHFCQENEFNYSIFIEDGIEVNSFQKYLEHNGVKNISVYKGPASSWSEWIKFISDFKIIYHADYSMNFGQLCLDAALVDSVCVGSTTTNNNIAGTSDFSNLSIGLEKVKVLLNCSEEEYMKVVNRYKFQTNADIVSQQLKRAFS